MKYNKCLILLCCLSSILFAQAYFPVCTYHCTDTSWFKGAGKDSLGLNMISFYGNYLDAAQRESLDVILFYATKGPAYRDGLEWYCRLHFGQWEAEHSTNFLYWNGDVVVDTSAHNDTAFWACVDSLGPCNMLKTKYDRFTSWGGGKQLDVIFYLKIEPPHSPFDTTRVCSLYVCKEQSEHLASRVIRLNNFAQTNQYQACTLSFYCSQSNKTLYHGIYWYDKRNLWCDYIEAKDRYIDSLVFWHTYDGELGQITQIYDAHPALSYYYLLDELSASQLAANAYLMRFLAFPHKPGIQAVSYRGADWYKTYVDSVKPKVLAIDYYPLNGDSAAGGETPYSGPAFDLALDNLCDKFAKARYAAMHVEPNPIPFWFVCQSFGQYDTLGTGTAYCRGSTPQELKCMTWLALAYNAKGIYHFLYPTLTENWWVDSGLTYGNGLPRKPLWTAAKEMNVALRTIGSRLLSLESDTVFRSNTTPPSECFINYVSDDLMQIGTFHDERNEDDRYFIIVNRHCLSTDIYNVTIGIQNLGDNPPSYLYDCLTKEIITPTQPPDPPEGVPPYSQFFVINLLPGQGRLLRLVPFFQEFAINQNQNYTNLPYVALRTKATSSLGIDSIKIWQSIYDPETLEVSYSTDWIPYDTAYLWFLQNCGLAGQETLGTNYLNTVYIQYKIGGFCESSIYADAIIYDKTVPSGSFVINGNDKFTNTPDVALNNSLSDYGSGMALMYYDNECLKNILKNSGFDNTSHWVTDTAIYHSDLKLFEIPIQDDGNEFYQVLVPESLEAFDYDTMRLAVDLVSDGFVGNGWVAFVYLYGVQGDTMAMMMGVYPYGDSIAILPGTQAKVSRYNLYSYFCYHPEPPPGNDFTEARVGIFVDPDANNAGRLFIDNLRLDVNSPHNEYWYDTLQSWILLPGNGTRYVYGQFADSSGNETEVLFDSIIVDTTKPRRKISSPQNGQTISGTVSIMGLAYDYADPVQHFKKYELKYQKKDSLNWYGICPESLFYAPKYSVSQLAQWNTREVTNHHGNGWYYLRLAVRDSAENYADTVIMIKIMNKVLVIDTMIHLAHYVYGLAAEDELYIGEFGTGMIYRYSDDYQLINSFSLSDSCGIGFPLALALDHTGKLWVTNIISQLVNRFANQGGLELRFGNNFSLPSGITHDYSGNIWITDRLHHKIKKFDSAGNLLFQFGEFGITEGKIRQPIGIGFHDNKLYVADSKNKRILVFDTLGSFVKTIGAGYGLVQPFGLAMDSTGCLFVSDFDKNRVLEFDPYGNLLFAIDSVFDSPSGLALSRDARKLYVSDTKHKRVLVFTVRGESGQGGGGPQAEYSTPFDRPMFDAFPSIFSKNLNIRLQGLQGENVTLKIYDILGRVVKTFYDNQPIKFDQHITWQGRDDQERKISCGVYFIELIVNTNDGVPLFKETRKAVLLR